MSYIQRVINYVETKHSNQKEFIQAVKEVLESLKPIIDANKQYEKHAILERLVVPDREIHFRVSYMDDKGAIQVNNGYRIQFNSALGPYKGGLRFHPSVNPSIIKFLGFEQVFKNSLTTLSMGGGKGGSDFDPKGKSDAEIMRFCQAFMRELWRYIGPTRDVPAGDIGVGGREIGYLFGEYKRLTQSFDGVLTGKGLSYGGSLIRKEATGYGAVYMAVNMLKDIGESLEGKICAVSGSGNVAIYTIEKLQSLGAKPVTISDSEGMIYDSEGIDLAVLKEIKEAKRGRVKDYLNYKKSAKFTSVKDYKDGENGVFALPCFAAFPSATQNEINKKDAENLIKNGCKVVSEGANMASSIEAAYTFINAKILYAPSKVANAGGVATSLLEMSQNASMLAWDSAKVDGKLQIIMQDIYLQARDTAIEFGAKGNLLLGGNIAGFRKVADAMIDQGL